MIPLGGAKMVLLLTANHKTEFLHKPQKRGLRLADRKYPTTGNLSLQLVATATDAGRYWCLVEQNGKQLKKSVVLLALLEVTVVPETPVPEDSTLRLSAQVTPRYSISMATWLSPAGVALHSETLLPQEGLITKLPRFSRSLQGIYTYSARLHGSRPGSTFQFGVTVTADVNKVMEFPNPTFDPAQSLACRSRATVPLACPPVLGDYVLLYWRPVDALNLILAYEHDRWHQRSTNFTSLRLRLLGPAHLATKGSFSFLLIPEQREGGLFRCEVFLNDQAYVQTTQLSVVHVFSKHRPSEVVLSCLYSEWTQVRRVTWTYQNLTLLASPSPTPGRIDASVPLPIGPDTAGNYTCTIQLQNGHKAEAVYTLTLPPTGDTTADYTVTLPPPGDMTADYTVTLPPSGDMTADYTVTVPPTENRSAHSFLPFLSALLLLVPVMTMVTGVFLWRRARSISRRGVEYSSQCGEGVNIYENPEDLRQGAVYMDLKPTGDDCVYKELDRYDQCK